MSGGLALRNRQNFPSWKPETLSEAHGEFLRKVFKVVIIASALSHHTWRGEFEKKPYCQKGDRFEVAASSKDAQVCTDGGINRGRRAPHTAFL